MSVSLEIVDTKKQERKLYVGRQYAGYAREKNATQFVLESVPHDLQGLDIRVETRDNKGNTDIIDDIEQNEYGAVSFWMPPQSTHGGSSIQLVFSTADGTVVAKTSAETIVTGCSINATDNLGVDDYLDWYARIKAEVEELKEQMAADVAAATVEIQAIAKDAKEAAEATYLEVVELKNLIGEIGDVLDRINGEVI